MADWLVSGFWKFESINARWFLWCRTELLMERAAHIKFVSKRQLRAPLASWVASKLLKCLTTLYSILPKEDEPILLSYDNFFCNCIFRNGVTKVIGLDF